MNNNEPFFFFFFFFFFCIFHSSPPHFFTFSLTHSFHPTLHFSTSHPSQPHFLFPPYFFFFFTLYFMSTYLFRSCKTLCM
ncbi:hypothetical protein C1646_697050 [Rhizophagus diaphanus]|nr:hypothetical protein C1646_697050 [Rhizophagus diaphanus] [Rhizophagus sp. MUCL 43196]